MISVLYTQIGKKLPGHIMVLCLAKMPDAVRSRISRYRRWEDQQAGICGKLLLAEGLRRYGYPPEYLQHLAWDVRERPFLDGKIDFNISHSGKYVVCALTSKGKVGIDIEKIKPINIDNFRTQMTCEQWQSIMESENRLGTFFDLWTQKEAAAKVDGRGIAIPLSGIIIKGNKACIENAAWEVRKMKIADGYACHLTTNVSDATIYMEKISCLPADED